MTDYLALDEKLYRRRRSTTDIHLRREPLELPNNSSINNADIRIRFRDHEDHSDSDNEDHPSVQPSSSRRPTYRSKKDGSDWFKDKFLRRGKRQVGILESLKTIVSSSWLNVFVIFIPLSWWAHFSYTDAEGSEKVWSSTLIFAFSLLALIPLEKLLDYGGEQMKFYFGSFFGDMVIVGLNNAVEGSLAIILLTKCELRLLQSTIIGVSLLHLLLVPGVSFMVGGARLLHQELNPHITQLNHTLLLMGVLTLLLPAAFYNTLELGVSDSANSSSGTEAYDQILIFSRGLAIMLHLVYFLTRFFMLNPPGKDNAFRALPGAPDAVFEEERELEEGEPEVNQWVCIVMLIGAIPIMEYTASYLVDSVEVVRETGHITEEWFGLILLPLVSFSADALLAVGYFLKYIYKTIRGQVNTDVLPTLAKARSIDISIQFTLLWMPLLVIIGWGTNRPMSLLFDVYEVVLVLGACLLVNYVTADAKTNWAEGFAMVAFYVMIALVSWFYTGEAAIAELLQTGSCASASQE